MRKRSVAILAQVAQPFGLRFSSTAIVMAINRKPREPIMKIDEGKLLQDWLAVCEAREADPDPRWAWDGSFYPKRKRSEGPSIQELVNAVTVLTPLIEQATNGYPDHVGCTNVLLKLSHRKGVLVDGIDKACTPEAQASLAADRWRIMAKHLAGVKKGKALHFRSATQQIG